MRREAIVEFECYWQLCGCVKQLNCSFISLYFLKI